ncbi:MAG: hypothetical protein ABL909_11190, partial [Sphingopyxis sp.]
MTLDRTEITGLSVAIAAHILLFAFLSFQWADRTPAHFDNPPMAVEIIAEAAPQATAPVISQAPPAARLGEPDSDEAETPPPPRAVVEPPKPPKPVVREASREPRPAPRPAPQAPPRRTPPPQAERPAVRTPPAPQRTASAPTP